jgi:hypothetical protein
VLPIALSTYFQHRAAQRDPAADRLDPVRPLMGVEERHHHFARRSSSASAKDAEALRKIPFARFSSRFSCSSSFSRWRTSVVKPGRLPASCYACRTQRRNVSVVQPSVPAMDELAAHWKGCSGPCSWTIRIARSRTSGEYRLGLAIVGSILSMNGLSDNPGTVQ